VPTIAARAARVKRGRFDARVVREETAIPTSIRIDARTEGLVKALAKKKGLTKSELIREAIHRLAESEGQTTQPRTVYDAIAHLIGCADSAGAQLLLARRRAQRSR
jgi:hypothetical protein